MSRLVPPSSFLTTLVKAKQTSVAQKKGPRAEKELKARIRDAHPCRPFQKAIARANNTLPRLIAEIKKASPSKGILRENVDPVEIAKIYEQEGASAISILTEEDFFLGQLSYLMNVKSAVSLPLLQKDFILDEFQIYEARAFGADAILLITALLTTTQIQDYLYLARELSMEALVEVHTEDELERVINHAVIIGINNRNLTTFKTDVATTPRILCQIPEVIRQKTCIVGESGIHSKEDVVFLADAGVDALLIGETFMTATSIPSRIKSLFGGPA